MQNPRTGTDFLLRASAGAIAMESPIRAVTPCKSFPINLHDPTILKDTQYINFHPNIHYVVST